MICFLCGPYRYVVSIKSYWTDIVRRGSQSLVVVVVKSLLVIHLDDS
jgi:hypothetical protein